MLYKLAAGRFRQTPSTRHYVAALLLALSVGIGLALGAKCAIAGGGPETTLVVVNADSAVSLRIANLYATLRDIPPSHLVWLHDVPTLHTITVKTFRQRIWGPIREFITAHGLEGQIDTIAYSADFPYAVNLAADIKANKLKKDRYRGSIASLTGLTFFARRVEIGDVGYLNLHANQYFRRNLAPRPASRVLTAAERELTQKAEKAYKAKDYSTAVARYRELTQSNTNNGGAWYNLARSLMALGHTQQAVQALDKAVDGGWTSSLRARNDRHLKKLRDSPEFLALIQRMDSGNGPFEDAQGFQARYYWDRWAVPDVTNASASLNRYYLSTLLAYTGVRGNSVPEVYKYLSSAAASDGTHPQGTVYLLENTNVRSEARQRFFPATVAALAERNRRALILRRGQDGQDGIVPRGRDDVVGAVVGAGNFNWEDSGSRLLPGAIAESLTSYGGDFNRRKQTKLSEFLRHGAAGSSGTVAEPFSFQEKFPVAMMHVYYGDGCSLAEAFYQSVSAPYQLLIVGDPLTRPFADFATVSLAKPGLSLPWRGTVNIRPRIIPAPARSIAEVQLWVDGKPVAAAPITRDIEWDTRTVEDGSHELRLVAVEAGRIETRSYAKYEVTIANTMKRVEAERNPPETVLGEGLQLSGLAPGADRVEVMRGFHTLGSSPVVDGKWRLVLASEPLGIGVSKMFARALFADGSSVRSRPISVHVLEPPRRPARRYSGHAREGLSAMVTTRQGVKGAVVVTTLDGRIRELDTEHESEIEQLRFEGDLRVGNGGFYQLVASSHGRLRIVIGDKDFGERSLAHKNSEIFLPLSLEAGWHRVIIDLFPEGVPRLKLVMTGDEVGQVLGVERLRHAPTVDELAMQAHLE